MTIITHRAAKGVLPVILCLLGGCKSSSSDSLVVVHVEGQLTGVRQFRALVSDGDSDAQTKSLFFPPAAQQTDIALPSTFSLRFPPGQSRVITFSVEAFGSSSSTPIATSARQAIMLSAGSKIDAYVCFGQCEQRDAGVADAQLQDSVPDSSSIDAVIQDAPTDRPDSLIADGSIDTALEDAGLADGPTDGSINDSSLDSAQTDSSAVDASPPDSALDGAQTLTPQPGTYAITPPLHYACSETVLGTPILDLQVSSLSISLPSNSLQISGLPAVLTGNVPTGGFFVATGSLAQGCDQNYSLSGIFSDATHFTGNLQIEFVGLTCAISNCSNQSWNISGAR